MTLVALALFVGLLPAARATTLAEPTAGVTESADASSTAGQSGGFDPGACLSTERAATPLGGPLCLKSVRTAPAEAPSSDEPTAPSTCKAPLYSDKCPDWAGAYQRGYDAEPIAQAVSPAGDRVYVSTVDWWGHRFLAGGGGGGATIVAVDRTSGQELWAVPVDDRTSDRAVASSLAVSPDGATLYATGMSAGTAEAGWDFLTLAYDAASGRRLWSSRYGGIGGSDGALSIALSGDGASVYVTGSSGATHDLLQNHDYATVAYRADSGQQLWATRYAKAGNDQPMSVAVDSASSRVFVTGFSSLGGSVFFGDYGVQDTNSYDYATVAYHTETGAPVWEQRSGTTTARDLAGSLGLAPDGTRVFVTGSSKAATGPSEFKTVAYDARAGSELWSKRYRRVDSSANDPAALAVSPDGQRVYVAGTSFVDPSGHDYATVAYETGDGEQAWERAYSFGVTYPQPQVPFLGVGGRERHGDRARDIAVSPDSRRVYVTGTSARDSAEDVWVSNAIDAATVAYAAYDSKDAEGNDIRAGDLAWVGRYNHLTEPLVAAYGVAVDVVGGAPGTERVIVGTMRDRFDFGFSRTAHGLLSYDPYGPGPEAPVSPAAPVVRAGAAEGTFSLMSMAHSLPSAAGGAVPWDGESQGDGYRYNSMPCSDGSGAQNYLGMNLTQVAPSSAFVNNISTNLTSYNTLVPGSASPTSTRTHPFEFTATADGAGRIHLLGRIELVACNLTGGATNDGRLDSDRPRVFFDFEATADKPAAQEARFEGTFTINGGTGIYEDVTGSGQMHGYLFCFTAPNNARAGACDAGGPFRDLQYTMTGWYRDPSVPGAPDVHFPEPSPVQLTPPLPGGPGVVEGPFSLMHMIHSGRWDGTAVGPEGIPKQWNGAGPDPDGRFRYSTMPCWANAPVNNVSTNLTTYGSRLPGSASPASTRNQPFHFEAWPGAHPRQRTMSGSIELTVCQRAGGPSNDGQLDAQREKIFFEVLATSERVSGKEIRFEGTFKISGGTGVYADLSGYGRIHGYLFCFGPIPEVLAGNGGGDCHGGQYRDGQYTMNGWYRDPTVAELGVGPTKVSVTDDSPRSGQYSDTVTPKAALVAPDGKPVPDAEVSFALAGAGGTKTWSARTDAQGVAGRPVTLDVAPGAYDLEVRYPGKGNWGPSSDRVRFTVAKEATATALTVQARPPGRTLVARVADDDGQAVAGVPVAFFADGTHIGAGTTDSTGVVTLLAPARYQGGPHRFRAAFAGDHRYLGSSGEAQT